MRIRRIHRSESLRLYIVMGVMVLAFLVLGASLWRLQVARGSQFESRIEIQSLRRVRLPGIRGKIYDRNGLCLADNRPTYSVALFLEELRRPGPWARTIDQAEEVIRDVSDLTGLTASTDRDDVWNHIRLRLPLPLVLWRDTNTEAMARLVEQGMHIPGVDIYTQATRSYPYSPYTSHVLGHVGRSDPAKMQEEEERYSYYLPDMSGRAGIEKLFDPFLSGEAGGALVQIDVSGYRHGEVARRAPKHGGDLRLTIDMEIQLLAHQALTGFSGAAVVLDPNNGDVLAMVSSPGYDANRFVPYITSKDWALLRDDPEKPLINRAVAGTYPPGSTFKPLVGLAAAVHDPAAVHQVYDCPGAFRVGRRIFRDWNPAGHGELDLQGALRRSANVYFFKTALACGWKPIIDQARAAGLGSATGVEVDFERPGLVPDADWKRATGRGGWSDGDTCNLSIGQGYLTVTPLQLAMMTATIANGGWLYRPRLVQAHRLPGTETYADAPVRRVGKMIWSSDALHAVREGMHDVIMDEDGTGKRARVENLDFAGKTGTAEYGPKEEGGKHTWMIAFAPFDNPHYAVAILIEDGVSGGSTVGPRMKILMEGLRKKLERDGRTGKEQHSMLNSQCSSFNAQCLEFKRYISVEGRTV
jgi:penicillin-binding protein 2